MKITMILATLLVACGASASVADRSPSFTATIAAPRSASPTVEPTKPPFAQPPLDPPSAIIWAIDRSDQSDRPYLFELHYDGAAMGFRVIDPSGRLILRLPIAGSGIFDRTTCMAALQQQRARGAATWILIDDPTLRELLLNGSTYQVDVDTVGHGTLMLPLEYSGCRRT